MEMALVMLVMCAMQVSYTLLTHGVFKLHPFLYSSSGNGSSLSSGSGSGSGIVK